MALKELPEWVATRFGLEAAHEAVLDRPVPQTPWYYGDGMTLMTLFGVQVATGVLLGLSYSGSPDGAWQSVRYITEEQHLGWFLRGLHYWSAGFMVVMLFYHLCRQVLVGGYKLPREGTWLVGVGLFFLVQIMALTGYILRGDERALYAWRVVLNGMYYIPWIGEELVLILQGGAHFGARTLSRVFATHAILVPALLALGVAHHVYLVVIRGITSPIERRVPIDSEEHHHTLYKGASHDEHEGEPFWPDSLADGMRMAGPIVGLAVLLAILAGPGELLPQWNLVRDAFPAEEWWFWWFSAAAALLPPALAPTFYVLLPVVTLGALAALPFVDRSPERGMRRRPLAVVLVIVAVSGLLMLSDLRRRSPWTAWPVDTPPEVPASVVLTPELEAGRQAFATYGCNTCHPVAGKGPRSYGPDLARLDPPRSYEELRHIVLSPPADWVMPAYAGRIAPQDLDLVVRYVLAAQTFPKDRRP